MHNFLIFVRALGIFVILTASSTKHKQLTGQMFSCEKGWKKASGYMTMIIGGTATAS